MLAQLAAFKSRIENQRYNARMELGSFVSLKIVQFIRSAYLQPASFGFAMRRRTVQDACVGNCEPEDAPAATFWSSSLAGAVIVV